MDFSLSNEQRAWQMTARKFARGGDQADLARARRDARRARHLRLGHRREGLEARLPHARGAEGIRRRRHRLRHPGAGDGRARARRQRDLQDLQPELEVEPPDLGGLQRRAEGALPAAVRGRPPLPARQGHHRADRRLRQPPAAEGRSQGRPEAARRAPRRRMDPERREMLHRQRAGRQAVLHRRAHRSERAAAPGHHHVPGAARHARLPHRQGVQQERLAVLPERRDDLRERARAARQRGRPGQHLRHEDRSRPATAPAATSSATSSLPPTRSASATTPASRR